MPTSWTRREAICLGVAGLGSLGLIEALAEEPPAHAPDSRAGRGPGRRPKNIIFMVADGMSLGVPTLAEPFGRMVRQQGTILAELLASPRPALGYFDMRSLSALVTDSAAAASSWGSGSRVFNNAINTLPDGRKLTPILELAKQAGRRTGLVTTTQMTHATPAGFAAVQGSRDSQEAIAPQYLDVVDVLMGGGVEHFDPTLRSDGRDLMADFAGRGYAVWTTRGQLSNDPAIRRVLGLFWQNHLPFTLDRNHSTHMQEIVPTLAEMTRTALATLDRDNPHGFIVQIEGGRVDHAAHSNDAAAILWDQLAFDDAVRVALEFAARDGDTLVVITTDHGNANPGLNGTGSNYDDTDKCFERLALATGSFEAMAVRLKRELGEHGQIDADLAHTLVRDLMGIDFTADEAKILGATLAGEPAPVLNKQFAKVVGVLGELLSNYNGVGWTGTSHTADWATIIALGPGQARFHGRHANTEAFGILCEFMGINHQNASMTPAEAARYRAAAVVPAPFAPAHVGVPAAWAASA